MIRIVKKIHEINDDDASTVYPTLDDESFRDLMNRTLDGNSSPRGSFQQFVKANQHAAHQSSANESLASMSPEGSKEFEYKQSQKKKKGRRSKNK